MKIGILTSNESNHEGHNNRIIEEVELRGHEAEIIDYTKTIVSVTEEGRQVLRPNEDGELEPVRVDSLIVRIGGAAVAGTIALKIFESNNVPATATVDSVKLSRDKLESHIEFDRVGIPTPYSVAPTGRSPEKAKKMFELVEPDKSKKMIIKTATGSLGKGVVLAESRRSAVTQIQAFEARKIRYFVQEFLESPEPEFKHSDIRLFVIDGLIVASMMRQSSDEDEIRANLDLGAKGFEYEPTPREEDLALRAYEVIGAKAVGVDIMKSHRGPLVVEVNTNPGFGIEKVTGKNVAAGIVDLAIKGAEQRS